MTNKYFNATLYEDNVDTKLVNKTSIAIVAYDKACKNFGS